MSKKICPRRRKQSYCMCNLKCKDHYMEGFSWSTRRGCVNGISGEWRALPLSSSLLRCDMLRARSRAWLLWDTQISGKSPTDVHPHWFRLQRVCFHFGPENASAKKLRRMGLQLGVRSCGAPQLQDLQINLLPLWLWAQCLLIWLRSVLCSIWGAASVKCCLLV